MSPAEKKIIHLSEQVIALQDTPEFEAAVGELRQTIHDYINRARDQVADLAFVVAANDDAKAA